mmetsp:Transcript_78344/g.155717  ORF Transcript_78344/g.155717 Transcript_78344/m.155717 type:complete len:205 (+) Transcript_78344:590-1204(+)
MAECDTSHAVHEEHVGVIEQHVDHAGTREDRLRAQGAGEPPSAGVIEDRVPCGDVQAVWKASELCEASHTSADDHAAHSGDAAVRCLHHLTRSELIDTHRPLLPLAVAAHNEALWCKAAATAHELVGQPLRWAHRRAWASSGGISGRYDTSVDLSHQLHHLHQRGGGRWQGSKVLLGEETNGVKEAFVAGSVEPEGLQCIVAEV